MAFDLTVARNGAAFVGAYRVQPFKYTGPASYAAGGEAAGSAKIGIEPEIMPTLVAWNGSSTRLVVYDYTAKKYLWYVPNTGSEVADGTDLSGYSARGVAWGR